MKRRGEDFGSVAIGTPWGGRGYYDFFRSFCWLLIGGGEDGDYFLNSERVNGNYPLPHAHNELIREFLGHTDADTLCIAEDDHVFDQDLLRRMRNKPANRDFDIVVAAYTARRGRPMIVAWEMVDPKTHDGYVVKFTPSAVQKSGTQQFDGSGVGFALIRRWLLVEMAGGKPPEDVQWFFWDGFASPDVGFYRKAKALGARLGVDMDNRIGHIGTRVWRFEDFERALAIGDCEERARQEAAEAQEAEAAQIEAERAW